MAKDTVGGHQFSGSVASIYLSGLSARRSFRLAFAWTVFMLLRFYAVAFFSFFLSLLSYMTLIYECGQLANTRETTFFSALLIVKINGYIK